MTDWKNDPAFRAWAHDAFVGNECDTDEYRETQPGKGLSMISDFFTLFETNTDISHHTMQEVIDLTSKWLAAVKLEEWYSGADELKPILDIIFEVSWDHNGHPYHRSLDDFIDDDTIEYFKEDLGGGDDA